MKKYTSKDKLPPGTVRHVPSAKKKVKDVFQVYAYNQEVLEKYQIPVDKLNEFEMPAGQTVWVHFPDTSDADALEAVGEKFAVHSLVLEDIQNTDHRPKMDDYPDFNFVIQKQLIWDEEKKKISGNHLAYIYKPNLVISFAGDDPFAAVRERLERKQGKIRQKKADYLLFCLLDVVSDEYFTAVDALETLLDQHEDEIISLKSHPDISAVLQLKKQLIHLKRNVNPLRAAVEKLRKSESPLVQEASRLFFRDLADHTTQLVEMLDVMLLSADSLVSMALNMASHQMNSVMKVLTVIATIFIPLTFIAGVYGMNFRNMPELSVPWAYPAVIGGMLVIGVIMLIIFKKKKWF